MTRIHPECYTLTATGRVTMHEPSVQNIPRDFEIHMPGESDVGVCYPTVYRITEHS